MMINGTTVKAAARGILPAVPCWVSTKRPMKKLELPTFKTPPLCTLIVLPIPEIFKQLAKQKYQGYCSLEYEINAKDPLPGMQKSFAYMRKVITDLKLG